jgi:hypothetical protein
MTSSASSSVSSSTSSVKSATPSGNIVKKEIIIPSKTVEEAKTVGRGPESAKQHVLPTTAAAKVVQPPVRSQSASSLSQTVKASSPIRKIEKSSSAAAPKPPASEKDLESLLDFIEGNKYKELLQSAKTSETSKAS